MSSVKVIYNPIHNSRELSELRKRRHAISPFRFNTNNVTETYGTPLYVCTSGPNR